MRKLASNYIVTPAGDLKHDSYLLVDGESVTGYALLSCDVPEEHGVEFYGGILIPGRLDLKTLIVGEGIISQLHSRNYFDTTHFSGVTLVSRLDWKNFIVIDETELIHVV